MLKKVILITALFTYLPYLLSQSNDRKMLETVLKEIKLEDVLLSKDEYHPLPTYSDSAQWLALPEEIRNAFLDSANKYLLHDWGEMRANLFLQYQQDGKREPYSSISYPRRIALNYLVLGEIIERKGRFMDKIIDGIYVICEETTWDTPAHIFGHTKCVFPDPNKPLVALMSAETAACLAYVDYLIGEKLDEISPEIRKRIYFEVNQRILTPALDYNNGFWLGFERNWANNWNPWVNSNWLRAVLLLEREPEKRVAAIKKVMLSLDVFINMYGDDGGCDEGPGYFGHAGAALYECLEILNEATNGAVNVFNEPLIYAMGDYVRKAHINDRYYVNFADAGAIGKNKSLIVYRYGKSTNNEALANFGLYTLGIQGYEVSCFPNSLQNFGRYLPNLFLYSDVKDMVVNYEKNKEAWLSDLQVVYARSNNPDKELFFAAKGGHNAESHNHNDVGNFMLFANGKPVVIDIGVETYNKKTFSHLRYTIWTMQSQFHNLPTINGFSQQNGGKYKASEVNFSSSKKSLSLNMNLTQAYPDSAQIISWKRNFVFDKSLAALSLTDAYDLENANNLEWNFMVYASVEKLEEGKLLLTSKDGGEEKIVLFYDANLFNLKMEEYTIEDKKLSKAWKSSLTRLVFVKKNLTSKGEATFQFKIY